MSRRRLSPRVRPGVELNEIVIRLHPLLGPTVVMRGEVKDPTRRRGDVVEATFETKAIPPEFEMFIAAVKGLFGEKTGGSADHDGPPETGGGA